MLRICLGLLAGAYALELLRNLPSVALLAAAAVAAAGFLCIRRLRLAGFFLLGALVVANAARDVRSDRLDAALTGQNLPVTLRIAGFPELRRGSVRFVGETDEDSPLPARLRLTWYDPADLPRIGETWRLTVRLKRPRGLANPSGFDYELWLARQRIGATGYVVEDAGNALVRDIPVDRRSALRARLVQRIRDVLGENDAAAVLMAITVGARHRITAEQWDRYAVSGTSHLMAISGLHIGLAAGGAYLIGWMLFAPLCRNANVRDLAAASAVAAACLYAGISGFAIPARRALLMALVAMLAFLLRREASAAGIIAVGCVAVFLADPLAVHAPGFKLSFGAVIILAWLARQRDFEPVGTRTSTGDRLARAARRLTGLQLCLLLGLFPLTALIFGRMPWPAPLVNLVALPVFNVVTVPAALIGLVLDGPLAVAGDRLLELAWHSVRLILWIVGTVADWPPARVELAGFGGLMLVVVLLPACWALAPPGFPGRKLALVAAAAACLHRPAPPPRDCLDLAVLDVGQGLAAVLRTHRRTLVFDTGPAFRNGGDTAELVLVPYLKRLGVRRVDLLVVSHSDLDHAGGAATLTDALDVRQILAGEQLPAVPQAQIACRRGQAWLWDGARFAILHPGLYPLQSDNNSSCVLEVGIGPYKLLFTGDIESPVENHLARTQALSAVDIVIVPHHGSGTSSTSAFVQALRPAVAIVAAGHANRWGFPREEVVRRWRGVGARVLNTAESGSVHYRLCADREPELLARHRSRHRKYWHEE